MASLVGLSITGVTYWDVHNYSDEPRVWDYQDWHHAVMGVEFATNEGPVSVIWTNTFYPYGVEALRAPIALEIRHVPDGPEGWDVSDHPYWQARTGSPISAVTAFWETLTTRELHPDAGAERSYTLPVAMRLDFRAGPVWMVAGMPQWPNVDDVFIPGDEIVLAFSRERMLRMGFRDDDFLAV